MHDVWIQVQGWIQRGRGDGVITPPFDLDNRSVTQTGQEFTCDGDPVAHA